MQLARRTRAKRRLHPTFDAANAHTLDRRAVDLHSFSDLVVGQTRTIDAFVCFKRMRACINVRADALPFDGNACNSDRSCEVSLTRYTFMERHFTGSHQWAILP